MIRRWIKLVLMICLAFLVAVSPLLIGHAQSIPAPELQGYEWTKTTPWDGGDFSEGLVNICYEDPLKRSVYKNLPFRLRRLQQPLKLCGYMDKTGKTMIEPSFHKAHPFKDGLALVGRYRSDSSLRYGYIDRAGKVVIPFDFYDAGDFSEGLAPVGSKSGWGYIDKSGKFAITPRFSGAKPFHEGIALASLKVKGNWFAHVNRNGKIIKRFLDNHLRDNWFCEECMSSEGLIAIPSRKNKFGYINSSGKLVIPYLYHRVQPFSEGLAVFYIYKRFNSYRELIKAGFINKEGEVVISFDVTSNVYLNANGFLSIKVNSFHEGLALVENNNEDGTCNYINREGKIKIEIKHATCRDFSNGLAAIYPRKENQNSSSIVSQYFIDRSGKIVFGSADLHRIISSFNEDLAYMSAGYGSSAYVNKKGEEIFVSPKKRS
jgi:WG containing repeat